MSKYHHKAAWQVYLEFVPFWLLFQLIHLLPLKAAYRLVIGLFDLLYLFAWRLRRRTVSHILHAGVETDPRAARRMARRVFREFSRLLVEIVKMDQCYDRAKIHLRGSPESIRRVFSPDGVAPGETNAIIVTAHYGNWEVAGTAFSDQSRRPMTSIMRPFSNPLVGEMILKHRRSDIHELVDKDAAGIRHLLKALKSNRNISILIDQHAVRAEGVETVFFGQPCRTHKTPALLHLKTGVPIIPELTRRVPGENFEFDVVVGDLIEYQPTGDKDADVRNICQLCTTALEKLIAEAPDQWLWVHRRWLNINRRHHTPSGETAPENAPANPPEK